MRIPSLALLPLLLLATQGLPGQHGEALAGRPRGQAALDGARVPKPRAQRRQGSPRRLPRGRFVAQDQAACSWAVTAREEGLALEVQCSRQDTAFSCVFTGRPASCLQRNKERAYWKQVGRALRSQKALCSDAKAVLKARVCRKTFPEASLKLASSTLLASKRPRQEDAALSRRGQSEVRGPVPSSPAGTQATSTGTQATSTAATTVTAGPQCTDDPEVAQQRRTALDYCGESWSSVCLFLLAIAQGTTC